MSRMREIAESVLEEAKGLGKTFKAWKDSTGKSSVSTQDEFHNAMLLTHKLLKGVSLALSSMGAHPNSRKMASDLIKTINEAASEAAALAEDTNPEY